MKTFIALLLGSLLTYIFLEFNVKPPEIFLITDKIKALPEQIIAATFLEDADSSLKQQQIAVSTLVRYNAGYYLEIDSLIGYQFTKKAINKITVDKIQFIKAYSNALLEKIDEEKYPALLNHYERKFRVRGKEAVLTNMMVEQIKEDALTYNTLQKKYPGLNDQEIASELLGFEKAE